MLRALRVASIIIFAGGMALPAAGEVQPPVTQPAQQHQADVAPAPATAPAAALVAQEARAASVSPEAVNNAIQKAQDYLLSQMNGSGNWELVAAPRNADENAEQESGQWGGRTALATYALLASGVAQRRPEMVKAIDFLKTADGIHGTYALGLRAQIWRLQPQSAARKYAQRDAELFLQGLHPDDAMYGYSCKDGKGETNRNMAQYGVLGMLGCERAGAEVPQQYWKTIRDGWVKAQEKDGGWASADPGKNASTAPMTLAGVASLYVAQEYLNPEAGISCKGNTSDPNIDRGLAWLAAKGDGLYSDGSLYHAMYAVERVGIASGRKYFGNLNWYNAGADILVKTQHPDGSWGDVPNTAFGLLFLARGRAPVIVNKLEYSIDTAGDTVQPANWNQRPRDVANFTEWLGEFMCDRILNWQVVNLKVSPVEDLHDSQILYISGNQPLQLGKEVEEKIKLFVEQGGLVVGHADCGHTGFADSFIKLARGLFGGDFRQLPAEHLVYGEMFDSKKWQARPVVRGLSNGVRELMVLLPMDDAGKSWQLKAFKSKTASTELMGNLVMYSVDKDDRNLRIKGDSYIVRPDPKKATTRQLELARLEYPGNWNPEPGGWRRLAGILHNQHSTQLDVETVKLGEGKLAGFKVAHLTGTESLNINEKGKEEVKAFVMGGGTLIVDAAGGSRTFGLSAEGELESMLGGKFQAMGAAHPALATVTIERFVYRRFAKKNLGQISGSLLKVMELNGRPVVFYSGEDLSAGLVGQPVDGIIGYDPATATAIMSNLVLFAGK